MIKKFIVYWYYKCYVVFKMDGEEKNIYLNGVEIVIISWGVLNLCLNGLNLFVLVC